MVKGWTEGTGKTVYERMEELRPYVASHDHKAEWVVIKALCDWADGSKHGKYQELAAASAVSLCLHVFGDPRALDGV